jgi:hypothetical protein
MLAGCLVLHRVQPLGTLGFCVTWHGPLEVTLAANPNTLPVAFGDGVAVLAGAGACLCGVHALIDPCEPLGRGVRTHASAASWCMYAAQRGRRRLRPSRPRHAPPRRCPRVKTEQMASMLAAHSAWLKPRLGGMKCEGLAVDSRGRNACWLDATTPCPTSTSAHHRCLDDMNASLKVLPRSSSSARAFVLGRAQSAARALLALRGRVQD